MGGNESKSRIQELEKRQESMMKEHADMVQRLADEQDRSRRQNEAAVEQMAKLMLVMIAANNQTKGTREEKTQLEIEGVTYTIVELLGELRRDLGLSMLFVTHNLPLVRSIADTVAVMSEGRIVELGGCEDVIGNPREAYTKALIENTPSIEAARIAH